MSTYKGWRFVYWPEGALHWRARRFGVQLTGGSVAALIEMIDLRGT